MIITYDKNGIPRIGGWLYWIGIGVVLRPFIEFIVFWQLSNLLKSSTAEMFYTWLILSLCVEVIMVFASIYLIYLFFKKRYNFPLLYKIFIIFSMLYEAVSCIYLYGGVAKYFEGIQFGTLVGTVIVLLYLQFSKRVKKTFIVQR